MPNPNISAALTPLQKTTLKANVDANKFIIAPFGVNLTPAQRQALSKTGSDSVSFVQDTLLVAKNNPTAVPGDMTVVEYEKDVVLFTDLNEIYLHHSSYNEMINDTRMAVGSEAMHQSNRIYENVKSLAKNDSAFQAIADQLGQRYALLRGPRTKTIKQKVMLAPNSSVTLLNVAPKSPFVVDGATDLMLCQGALTACTNGTQVNSGNTTTVPEGITTITVTNLSNSVNGSFSVKITE